jgi:phage gpG-like protein
MPDSILRINVTGLVDARSLLDRLPSLLDVVIKDSDTLEGIGTVLYKSAITTIDQGGRPLYKPLAQSTINRRWKREQGKAPGKRENRQGIVSNQPLKDSGILRSSLKYTVGSDGLTLDSIEYLKYHQFEEGRTKARFPARPIWSIQDEDKVGMTAVITDRLSDAITSSIKP